MAAFGGYKKVNSATSPGYIEVSGVHGLAIANCRLFLTTPEILADMINYNTAFMELVIAVTVGYLAYDLLDLLYYKGFQASWSLLLHHIVMMVCFSIALVTRKYLGYALFALAGEANSIFLHARQLMLMLNYPKTCPTYRLNGVLNLATFILFRFGVNYYMSDWLYRHAHLIPAPLVATGATGLLAMVIINIVLFQRVIRSDYIHPRTEPNGDIMSN